MKENTHNIILDIAKLICAFLIVGIHTNLFWESNVELNFLFVQVLPRIAVPFFFMISSYFFAKGIEKREEKQRKEYVRKKITYLIKLYIQITIVYIIVLFIKGDINITWSTMGHHITTFFARGSYYHLWFLIALIYNTILYNKLRKYNKIIFLISILCYVLGILFHSYRFIIQENSLFRWLFNHSYLYDTFRGIVTYAFPFYWLGVIIARIKPIDKKTVKIGMIVSIILFFIEIYTLHNFNYNKSYTITIFLYPMCFFVFYQLTMIQRTSNLKIDLGKISLLIYLLHPLMIEIVIKVFKLLKIEVSSLTIYCLVILSLLVTIIGGKIAREKIKQYR